MPNHITNIITTKNSQDFEKLKELLRNGEILVDFNKVIPISKDLDITAGCYTYNEDDRNQKVCLTPFLNKYYNNTITQSEFLKTCKSHLTKSVKACFSAINYKSIKDDREVIENITKSFFNLKRYGYTSWYYAQVDKWGTKWNAYDICINSNTICFDTAWATPLPVLREISKHFPIYVAYADEDIGNNYGVMFLEDGKETYLKDCEGKIGHSLVIKDESIEEYTYDLSKEEIEEETKAFNEMKDLLKELKLL